MARDHMFIDAPRERVFAILSDASTYAEWVVGSRAIRRADGSWPARGTRFAHTVGLPPLTIDDETEVIDADPPARLELHAKARPLPTAHVRLMLEPEGSGTRVTMVEDLANPLLNLLGGPVVHAAMRARNRISLRRLKRLAERGRDGGRPR
jgi:uncharacterized protein YndB with AHSA1/START domain